MRVEKSGPIFDSGRAIPKAISEVAREVTTRGVIRIYKDTPVRTGNLADGWYATDWTIENAVFYGWFVERGTKYFNGRWMVRRNFKAIEDDLKRTLGDRVQARLQ